MDIFELEKEYDETAVSLIKCEILFLFAEENGRKILRANVNLTAAIVLAIVQLAFWLI